MQRYDRRVRAFAAGLSGLAGFVDASGFVLSKGFFVSFMSGNSTRLGVGIAAHLADFAAAAGLIVAFTLGVAGGSLLGRISGAHRAEAVLAAITALLAIAATLLALDEPRAALALTAFAMGAENAIFEQDGQVRIGLTYMTGSLVKVGQGLAAMIAGAPQREWLSYLALWLAFVAGAAGGAATTTAQPRGSLWAGSVLALLFGLVASRLKERAA